MKHWHIIEKNGKFHQTATEGEAPKVKKSQKLVQVKEFTHDPICHKYVDGKLVFNAEKRSKIDFEMEIVTCTRLELWALIEKMVDAKIQEKLDASNNAS